MKLKLEKTKNGQYLELWPETFDDFYVVGQLAVGVNGVCITYNKGTVEKVSIGSKAVIEGLRLYAEKQTIFGS